MRRVSSDAAAPITRLNMNAAIDSIAARSLKPPWRASSSTATKTAAASPTTPISTCLMERRRPQSEPPASAAATMAAMDQNRYS
ncbi:hypothetical protein D3C71_1748580 [compost metagenome]